MHKCLSAAFIHTGTSYRSGKVGKRSELTVRAGSCCKTADVVLQQSSNKAFSNIFCINYFGRHFDLYGLLQFTEDTLKTESNKLQIKINFWEAEVKSLATAIPDWISALKKLHYFRLKEFDQRLENLPQSPEEAVKRGFTKAAPNENWYHRGKGQIDNEKYYHKITGQELVFDKNGKIVTDHENIGTKNYGTNPKSWEHVKFDVIPYYIWGNSPEDTTPLYRRIFGYH